jgi:hypothetical protein
MKSSSTHSVSPAAATVTVARHQLESATPSWAWPCRPFSPLLCHPGGARPGPGCQLRPLPPCPCPRKGVMQRPTPVGGGAGLCARAAA